MCRPVCRLTSLQNHTQAGVAALSLLWGTRLSSTSATCWLTSVPLTNLPVELQLLVRCLLLNTPPVGRKAVPTEGRARSLVLRLCNNSKVGLVKNGGRTKYFSE